MCFPLSCVGSQGSCLVQRGAVLLATVGQLAQQWFPLKRPGFKKEVSLYADD